MIYLSATAGQEERSMGLSVRLFGDTTHFLASMGQVSRATGAGMCKVWGR